MLHPEFGKNSQELSYNDLEESDSDCREVLGTFLTRLFQSDFPFYGYTK